MNNHLISCLDKTVQTDKIREDPSLESFFLIECQAKYFPYYWIYLSISKKTTLNQLDKFLRNLWLECCGHLSNFSFVENGSTISKKTKVEDIFALGLKLAHTYDYGSSTILEIKIKDLIIKGSSKKKIQLLSRNEFPPFICNNCNEIATYYCIYCSWGDEGNLCDQCRINHNCESSEDQNDYILPMNVNSPRVGVCGPLELV